MDSLTNDANKIQIDDADRLTSPALNAILQALRCARKASNTAHTHQTEIMSEACCYNSGIFCFACLQGMTALHFAASSGHAGLVETFLEAGCDTRKKTDQVLLCSIGALRGNQSSHNPATVWSGMLMGFYKITHLQHAQLCFELFRSCASLLAYHSEADSLVCLCKVAD